MNREELICSPEYLLERIQIEMFYAVRTYLEHSDLNNEDELQKYLKLTDKQMEDMMDGNSDLKLNKLVEVLAKMNMKLAIVSTTDKLLIQTIKRHFDKKCLKFNI